MRRVPAVPTGLIMVLALLTGCTTASTRGAVPTTSAATSGSGSVSVSSTPTPSAATDTATPLGATELTAALLAASDVSGYRTTTITDSGQSPLPCTAKQPPLTTQVPPAARVQAAFASTTTRSAFREQLLGYTGTADAEAAYAAVQDGFNCSTGTLDGATVRIARVGAVQQGGNRGERWDFTLSDGTLGSTVVGQVGATIVEIDFVADASGSSEADPGAVLQKALQKLAANTPKS